MEETTSDVPQSRPAMSELEREDGLSRKSGAELRIERLTWFGLVSVLIIAGILPDWFPIHKALVPICSGLILVGSAIYQSRQRWRVGYSIWIAGALMLGLAVYNVIERPDLDLSLIVIVLVILVLAVGVFGGET